MLLFFSLALFISVGASAQDYKDAIIRDVNKAANVYYPYHRADSVYTACPKGYKPFYISHYGRHGSRYHSSDKCIKYCLNVLQKADSLNLLTKDGKDALRQIRILYNAHQGMLGMLSPRGVREHKAISQRLYKHFPEIFNQSNKDSVRCVSSPYPRCLVSMASFTNNLASNKNSLKFSYQTGDRYFQYICNIPDYEGVRAKAEKLADSLRHKICHTKFLYKTLFNNTKMAEKDLGSRQKFAKDFYLSAAICPDLDFLHLDLFKYFNINELIEQAKAKNVFLYAMMSSSKELYNESCLGAKALLRDIVNKADSCVNNIGKASKICADFRFGHDTGIMPLLTLMAVDGLSQKHHALNAAQYWYGYQRIPMGTNLQMIFYKNAKNNVIVKLLYNEREVTLDGLKSKNPPYYNWTELKKYLSSIAN